MGKKYLLAQIKSIIKVLASNFRESFPPQYCIFNFFSLFFAAAALVRVSRIFSFSIFFDFCLF